MRVIDIHRHFWMKTWWSNAVAWQFAVMASGWRRLPKEPPEAFLPRIGERICDPEGTKIIHDMDDLGIDVSLIQHMDWGMAFKEDAPTPIEDIAHYDCYELPRKYPGRVYGMVGIDPRRPGAVKLFEKAVTEWGAKGAGELYPPFGIYPNDPLWYPFYQKAVEMGVPVSIHCGFTHWPGLRSKYAHPIYIDDVAGDFPELTIIICHSAMDKTPSTSWWEVAVSIAQSKLNVYLDVTDWQNTPVMAMEDMAEVMRKLKIMRDFCGAHRILFGTDQPAVRQRDHELTRQWVQLFTHLPDIAKDYGVTFSWEETELIMHGNAERILKI
ncbi:MAG: amidohydrolase family protein [Candidatus Binatia bacterium]